MNLELGAQFDRPTIAKQIAGQLKDAIVWLDMKPGDVISESEIGSRFGVSRQPVREAFIQLAEQGLLRIRPQRATEVVRISVRDVLNAVFVRAALEIALVKKAAAAGPYADDYFDDILTRQDAASAAGDRRGFQTLDDAFHRMIAGLAEREHVWRLIDTQKAQMDRVRVLSLELGIPQTIEEHRRIARAVVTADPKAAEEAMRDHLYKIEAKVWGLRERNIDYFVPGESPETIRL